MDRELAARAVLCSFRRMMQSRDALVRFAFDAGLAKLEIHRLSGIARTTIDRILETEAS